MYTDSEILRNVGDRCGQPPRGQLPLAEIKIAFLILPLSLL